MDKFNLKKYLAESRLLKEENISPESIKQLLSDGGLKYRKDYILKKSKNKLGIKLTLFLSKSKEAIQDGELEKIVNVINNKFPNVKPKIENIILRKGWWYGDKSFSAVTMILPTENELKEGKLPIDYNIDPEKNWSAISDILMDIKDKKSAKEFIDEYVSYVKNVYKDEKMVQYGNLVYAAIKSIYHNIDEWEGTEDAYPLSSDVWEKIISQKIKKDKI